MLAVRKLLLTCVKKFKHEGFQAHTCQSKPLSSWLINFGEYLLLSLLHVLGICSISYLHKLFKLLPFKTSSFLVFSLAKWSSQPFFQSVKFATDHFVCRCIPWHKLQCKWLFFLDTNKLSALASIFLLLLSKHSLKYLYSWFSLSDSSSLSSVPNLISLMSILRMPFRILASKFGKTIFFLWMFAISYQHCPQIELHIAMLHKAFFWWHQVQMLLSHWLLS